MNCFTAYPWCFETVALRYQYRSAAAFESQPRVYPRCYSFYLKYCQRGKGLSRRTDTLQGVFKRTGRHRVQTLHYQNTRANRQTLPCRMYLIQKSPYVREHPICLKPLPVHTLKLKVCFLPCRAVFHQIDSGVELAKSEYSFFQGLRYLMFAPTLQGCIRHFLLSFCLQFAFMFALLGHYISGHDLFRVSDTA